MKLLYERKTNEIRILVIEDEPAINDLLCMNLEITGYQTVSYLDGDEASVGIVSDHKFQCALVDIMLPGKDGYALLPELTSVRHSRHFSHCQS